MTRREMSPQEKRALDDSDWELERIRQKYLSGRILDDGQSDALSYAVTELKCAEVTHYEVDQERWTSAINDATRPDAEDWSRLREEIKWDGRGFVATERASELWKQYGTALLNLADSIMDPL